MDSLRILGLASIAFLLISRLIWAWFIWTGYLYVYEKYCEAHGLEKEPGMRFWSKSKIFFNFWVWEPYHYSYDQEEMINAAKWFNDTHNKH